MQATLGVSSLSGLGQFCFGSYFPVKERLPVDQRFPSLLGVASGQVSLLPACQALGLLEILEGPAERWTHEEKRVGGALFAPPLGPAGRPAPASLGDLAVPDSLQTLGPRQAARTRTRDAAPRSPARGGR